jgi:hypothetical protein
MRFEAKHSFLKGLLTKNLKNVPKSIALDTKGAAYKTYFISTRRWGSKSNE